MPNAIDNISSTISAFFRGVMIVGGGALIFYLLYRLAMFVLHSIAVS